MIWTSFDRATFRDSFCALHHQGAAERAEVTCGFGFNGILAFWIIGTAIEETKTSPALGHHAGFADRARHAGTVLFFQFGIFLDVFTLRIIGAGNKLAKFAFTENQLAIFALGAFFAGFFRPSHFLAGDLSGAGAVRIFSATQEFAGSAELHNHRSAADRANMFGIRLAKIVHLVNLIFGFHIF